MLKQRIITGLIMAAIIISGIWFMDPLQFALVSAAVMGLAAWEWAGLSGLDSTTARSYFLAVVFVVMLILSAVASLFVLLAAAVILLWLCEQVYLYAKQKPVGFLQKKWRVQLVGVLLFVFCWIGLNAIYAMSTGRQWLIYAIALIACMDTAGYFVGKKMGRRKLCVRVSPNKTWEGFWGGLICVVVLAAIMSVMMHLSLFQAVYLVLISIITGGFALYGDLIESLIKRQAGAKDSGSLLPGHGGVLDRIDGWLAAIPVFALLLVFIVWV